VTGLVRLAALAACALAASAARADDPPKPPAPTPEELVRDLGSPSFAARDRATRELWKLGEKARPALAAAADSPDAEIARRAKEILEQFDWGVLPDTPADVLRQIREFRSNIPEKQLAAVTALIKLGEPAVPTLRRLLSKDLPRESRAAVFEHLHESLRQEVPGLLLAGKPDLAESLLALNALGPSDAGLLDYAVFLHLRGRAKPAAAELEKVRKAGGPPAEAAAKALVFVYRAAGEADKARAAARELDEAGKLIPPERFGSSPPNLYESLLEDLGAWGALADRPVARANSDAGLKTFRLRLAGRLKEADEVADAQKDAGLGEPTGSDGLDEATVALLLNHRPLDGIDRLKARRNSPHILADVLAARLQFDDALALVASPDQADDAAEAAYKQQLYGTRKGRLLAQLGRRDAAAQVFGLLAEQVTRGDGSALTQLIRAEVRSGRFDLACEHLGKALAAEQDGRRVGRRVGPFQDPFELLFDADADAAQYWWRALRQAKPADEPPGATMRLVRALLTGTATAADLDRAAKAANRDVPPPESADGQTRALALAAAYRAAGKPDEAIAALAEVADRLAKAADDEEARAARRYAAGSRAWVFGIDERFRFWVELSDLLTEQGRHKDAAARLEQGWRKYPDNPVLLYLSGRAMVKAGDAAEGRRRTELAHWVALGNARLRGRFLEELVTRGAAADAKRERELVREAGWVSEVYVGNVWNQAARASVLLKDFDAAAAANRRAIHYLLRNPGVSYVEGYAYLTVPAAVRAYTARGLLAAGKIDEAVAQAKECLAVMPGHTDLVIGMVPELDRLGRKKEADELFKQVWDAYGAVVREHPESGWARYSAAWLAAGCRRELDAALAHARKAVELDPELRAHKEALAEVRFRRGERDQAVSLMKELVAADRRNHHYKRQLERYQTGDITSPLPDADDD
jgi:tetratricopeptide (TPR) repeat protein